MHVHHGIQLTLTMTPPQSQVRTLPANHPSQIHTNTLACRRTECPQPGRPQPYRQFPDNPLDTASRKEILQRIASRRCQCTLYIVAHLDKHIAVQRPVHAIVLRVQVRLPVSPRHDECPRPPVHFLAQHPARRPADSLAVTPRDHGHEQCSQLNIQPVVRMLHQLINNAAGVNLQETLHAESLPVRPLQYLFCYLHQCKVNNKTQFLGTNHHNYQKNSYLCQQITR